MRVLLTSFGSRGDIEPVAALGARLRDLGLEVLACVPPDEEFEAVLARAGVRLVPAFRALRPWLAEVRKGPVDLPQVAGEVLEGQYRAMAAAAEGCDAVVGCGLFPSTAAAQAVAEERGLAYVHVSYCPLFIPSPHHPPYAYPGHPRPPGITDNRALWDHNSEVMNALFGAAVNGLRVRIGLPALTNVRDHVFTDSPWLASDPILSPWPPAASTVVQTGAWILPDERPLPADLEAFLAAGPPPVYAGFGSMSMPTAQAAGPVAIAAIRAQGHRVLLARGWAGLALAEAAEDCFLAGDVNQQALFPRVAAVVHHGGAGTTTAAARAGVPQVIVPQLVDQPFWAGRVAALGIGVAHDGPAPSLDSLSAALAIALAPETRARAAALAKSIRTDGAALAAGLLLDMTRR
ncbi:glycosyltransferase [Labrys neptuniae]|uniref:glycosyltransferase n=1 Tax=Labrys neptuniae TaxID=376174 RepID=UPI0028908A8A|nr:glycosyltransferase [Labrys neptuniae]MDT3382409.1 glycosyltransferase [Labrys neptuniae]